MNADNIKAKINHCIDRIYNEDGDLFQRNNYKVTISTKLAQYLFNEFQKYDVDCEYNKHIDGQKRNEKSNRLIRLDIVIHKRGGDESNLVCIEVKTDHNRDSRTARRLLLRFKNLKK